jgi:foldase protein PrsA
MSMRFLTSVVLVVLLGTAVFYLAKRYRGLVIAGIVNKTPITRWELNKTLSRRYGQAVLDELVNNQLLTQEATKQGITVSQVEIDAERTKLAESLGGEENLASAMVQYGLSDSDLQDQLRLRLLQEGLSAKMFDIQVSEEEVAAYFTTNATLYEGKQLEDVRDEITASLRDQKLQQEFFTWFDKAKQDAQVTSYLD